MYSERLRKVSAVCVIVCDSVCVCVCVCVTLDRWSAALKEL